ncbi:MAG: VIT and VWA domain-containing protein [Planctomycetota bacterium]
MATLLRLALFLLLVPVVPAQLVTRGGSDERVRLASQTVQATIDDGFASVRVRQVFRYEGTGPAEAIYEFPLPVDASMTGLSMTVGGERLEGVLAERRRARRVYDEIVRKRRDPALLEQIGDGRFRLSVAPVLPHVDTVVEISYDQRAPLLDGAYTLTVPLSGAYAQNATTTATVDVRSSGKLGDVTASVRGADVATISPRRSVVSWERAPGDDDVAPPEGLSITARLANETSSFDVRTYRDEGGDTWFRAVFTPGAISAKDVMPRDLLLVLDTSGSMMGQKLERARQTALRVVAGLRETDRMNVLLFSSDVEAALPAMSPMTEENRAKLHAAIDGAEAGGSTALGDALLRIAEEPPGPNRARLVVLLTDGRPTFGITDPTRLLAEAQRIAEADLRLHAFGIGDDVDAALLHGIAAATRGGAELFASALEIEPRVRQLLSRTSAPVLTDVRVRATGVELIGLHPRRIPDTYAGTQVVVSGRLRGHGPATFEMEANGREGAVRHRHRVNVSESAGGDPAVGRRYASAKLDDLRAAQRLHDQLSRGAPGAAARDWRAIDRGAYRTSDEIVSEMIATSLRHGVQCAYTSFLAVEAADRRRLHGDQNEEEPIVEDFEVSDHNEADSNEAFERTEGDPDRNADSPFDSGHTNSVLGIGGARGGRYEGRFGGRRNLRAGGGKGPEQAVKDGLEWLRVLVAEGNEPRPLRAEALALLAFAGDGSSMTRGPYRAQVKTLTRRLLALQDPATGMIQDGPERLRADVDHALDHCLAATALTELYAIDKSVILKRRVEQALRAASSWFDDRANVASLSDEALLAAVQLMTAARDAKLTVRDLASATAELQRRADADPTNLIAVAGVLTAAGRRSQAEDPVRARVAALVEEAARRLEMEPTRDAPSARLLWRVADVPGPAARADYRDFAAYRFETLLAHQRKDGTFKGSWQPESNVLPTSTAAEITAACVLALEADYRIR